IFRPPAASISFTQAGQSLPVRAATAVSLMPVRCAMVFLLALVAASLGAAFVATAIAIAPGSRSEPLSFHANGAADRRHARSAQEKRLAWPAVQSRVAAPMIDPPTAIVAQPARGTVGKTPETLPMKRPPPARKTMPPRK